MKSINHLAMSVILLISAIVLCTMLIVLPKPGLAEEITENNYKTFVFLDLVEKFESAPTNEARIALCEDTLASGYLLRNEVATVYGFMASCYFEMALRQEINPADNNQKKRDSQNQIALLMRTSVQHYNSAIAINPNQHWCYWNRGYIYELSGNLDKALNDYEKTLEIKEDFIDAYLYRARVLLKLGKHKLAKKDIDTALKLDPENLKAKAAKQHLINSQENK